MTEIFRHKTKHIAIKTGEIDVEIIPIINWLNSYDFIITLYCCEGREEGDPGWDSENKGNINSSYQPYISFLTYSYIRQGKCFPLKITQFNMIKKRLLKYGEFDKNCGESDSKDGRFHNYCFRFKDKPTMREFIEKEINKIVNKDWRKLLGVFGK